MISCQVIMKIIYIFLLFSMLLGCSEETMKAPIDFKNLTIPHTKPNYYLVCPKNICHIDTNPSPIYKTTADNLYHTTISIIHKIERTKIIHQDNKNYKLLFVQKTRLFKFPDYIDIQIFPTEGNKSTIAIFSRAEYGYYDFGVNKRRVINLITELSKIHS